MSDSGFTGFQEPWFTKGTTHLRQATEKWSLANLQAPQQLYCII